MTWEQGALEDGPDAGLPRLKRWPGSRLVLKAPSHSSFGRFALAPLVLRKIMASMPHWLAKSAWWGLSNFWPERVIEAEGTRNARRSTAKNQGRFDDEPGFRFGFVNSAFQGHVEKKQHVVAGSAQRYHTRGVEN